MNATLRVITMTYGRYKFSLAPAGTRVYIHRRRTAIGNLAARYKFLRVIYLFKTNFFSYLRPARYTIVTWCIPI